jgi:endonuclease G, mitochondrial
VNTSIRNILPSKLFLALAGSLALLLGSLPAHAIVDTNLQMQLGNPSGATADPGNTNHYLIVRPVEAIDYNATRGQANWVSWDLTAGDATGPGVRKDIYYTDTSLPAGFYRVTDNDYSGSGWSRGHMCPSADRIDTQADNDMLFILSNLIPQAGHMNSGVWDQFENYCRDQADAGHEVLITCGPSQFTGATIASGHLAISGYNWKIVVVVPSVSTNALNLIDYSTRVIAVDIPNSDSNSVPSTPWANFVVSVNQLQAETGFTFFTALPPNVAAVLRSKVDGQTPPAPAISGFSPASGSAGMDVTITGTNLNFTTNVTFNGTSASFSIISSTNLTATVPAGATSGYIGVATLGGSAASAGVFSVGAPVPDLAVTASHSGAFIQGDTGDTYTLIVANLGAASSSGTVTVVDALPSGLTATSISGTGWTADLPTLTCTRADAVATGSAFPAITVTVNVATNAPASVTNVVTVSGGGDGNSGNNTASDPTSVLPAAAPIATTTAATAIGTSTATLNGTVNPNNRPASVSFDYGLTASYGSTAVVAGNLTGATAQPVSASISGLLAETTYHFRVAATNLLGSATGLDQTFATIAAGVPDLAVALTHTGNFTQGDTGDTYSIVVTNLGTAASSGSITLTDTLPAGLTATAISGSGWTVNLSTLTCTRSDPLDAGAVFPAITLTVSVASNAPGSVTNLVAVSGGGETNFANNTASDPTTILPSGPVGALTTLIGWDVNPLSNYGPSPLSPTTNAANLSLVGLTRGAGVGTSGSGAARAWGGNNWTDTSSGAAITANHFATFSVAAKSSYTVSFSSISRFDYRRSTTGPSSGLLQYQVGAGTFTDLTNVSYPTIGSGASVSVAPIDLSRITALQNIGAGTNVTFRIVNWGGTGSDGTWYIFDTANSTAPDFAVQGIVSPVAVSVADLAVSLTHSGSFTQGDTGRTYTITVTNIGTAPTVGTVSITNFLPAGLSATAISGSGWTANLGTLTCTRSDALAAGATYPPITLTVNVLGSAAASVTNVATVGGGGETSTANNTASDPTTILPASAPAVSTGLASAIATSAATLNGTVNPNGQPASVGFEYGLTASYGSVLPVAGNLTGATAQPVSAALSGLLPATIYHFRVAATNVLGATQGADQVFTTLAPIEAWRLQWFGTTDNSGAAADTAIATSDGMPNLLKYALGLCPTVATNDPVAGDISTGYLRLTAPKNPQATDVSFHVELASEPMAAWSSSGTTVDVNSTTLLQAHADAPVASSERGFLRLRVSRP